LAHWRTRDAGRGAARFVGQVPWGLGVTFTSGATGPGSATRPAMLAMAVIVAPSLYP